MGYGQIGADGQTVMSRVMVVFKHVTDSVVTQNQLMEEIRVLEK